MHTYTCIHIKSHIHRHGLGHIQYIYIYTYSTRDKHKYKYTHIMYVYIHNIYIYICIQIYMAYGWCIRYHLQAGSSALTLGPGPHLICPACKVVLKLPTAHRMQRKLCKNSIRCSQLMDTGHPFSMLFLDAKRLTHTCANTSNTEIAANPRFRLHGPTSCTKKTEIQSP